ncbi:MAG: hypothetical protein ACP5US_11400 [Candidatus Kryptoniota bacterium]
MQKVFKRRFEFYYQSVAVYATAFIIYVLIRGTFSHDEFKIVFRDPIVYVFAAVILYSLAVLVYNLLYQRDVIVEEDAIVFRNRFNSKRLPLQEIESIVVGRPKRVKVRGSFKVIKLRLKRHFKVLRINPVHFQNELDMIKVFQELSQRISKNV